MIMKRMILSLTLVFGFAAFASAQTASRNSSVTTRGVSTSQKVKANKKNLKPSDTLNNRKSYMFKNGQRATPTGAEATPSSVGGQFAAIGRKRAPAVKKDTTTRSRVRSRGHQ